MSGRRAGSHGTNPARVLIVESGAHRAVGHYPVMFAELAEAIGDAGRDVAVLTSQGWVFDAAPHRFELYDDGRLGRVARALERWIGRIRPRRWSRPVGRFVREVAMIVSIRLTRRRLGGAEVIVTSHRFDPVLVTALAGNGRWVLYQFAGPTPAVSRVRRAFVALAQRAEVTRRSKGGHARVAVNNPSQLDVWTRVMPWLDPVQVPFIASRERLPIADARERLGLDPSARVALLFGARHGLKDYDVVWSAFAACPTWHLVVAGGGAMASFEKWRSRTADTSFAPTVIDGFVGDETRDLLHAAADVVVLSFKPGAHSDSGTLADAVSWGLPVVCSSDCYAGEIVRRLGLGPMFDSGDVESLRRALDDVPRSPDPEAVSRARDEFSSRSMAERHLRALGSLRVE